MENKRIFSVKLHFIRIALNGQSKEYLTKEEFLVFCLNETDILLELIKFK